jgi:hypothetical protein
LASAIPFVKKIYPTISFCVVIIHKRTYNILTELQATALRPGAEEAKPLLVLFDEIDRQDCESPLGDAGSMSIDELRERVPAPPPLRELMATLLCSCLISTYYSLGAPDPKRQAHCLLDREKAATQVTGVAF